MLGDLAADPGAHAAAILAEQNLYGALVIASDQPDMRFEIEDEIEALVFNVCLRPLADLTKGRSVAVRYFSWHGYFRMDPEATELRVSGEHVPDMRLPFRDTLVALFRCAERYLDFLRRLVAPAYRTDLLATEVEAARETVRAAGYL